MKISDSQSASEVPERPKKYAQLHSALASEIQSGGYSPGDFLPSEPQLAQRFAISRSTVRQALFFLEQDGLVERLPGKGTVVVDRDQNGPTAKLAAFAIVLPEIQTGFYPAFVDGFASAASDLHYQIMVCTTGNEVVRQGDIILQLLDKRVAGVALFTPTVGSTPAHHFRQLQSQGIPIVLLHRAVENISAPLLVMPYEAVIRRAAQALLEKGHRRIALMMSHRSEAGNRYVAALRQELVEAGSNLPNELIHFGSSKCRIQGPADASGLEEISAALKGFLSLPDDLRPTALIDPWDSDMESCYFMLTKAGIRVPEEMSLVSFGGANRPNSLAKRLAAVTVDETTTAKLTAQLLDEMRRDVRPITDSSQFPIPLGFYVGETVSIAPAAAPAWR
jgi:GntR family transcriptional regulator, arabinose operon transcriptional repressor